MTHMKMGLMTKYVACISSVCRKLVDGGVSTIPLAAATASVFSRRNKRLTHVFLGRDCRDETPRRRDGIGGCQVAGHAK